VIVAVPSAPINLANDGTITSDLIIKFTWSAGASNGGLPILGYNVYYDNALGNKVFVLLSGGVTNTYYTTTNSLTAGAFYTFTVTAINSVGESDKSSSLTILAAKLPFAPVNLANNPSMTTAYQVGLTWSAGSYNGGTPITNYILYY